MVRKDAICFGIVATLLLFPTEPLICIGEPQGNAKVDKVTMRYAVDARGRRKYKLIVGADASTTLGMLRTPLQFSANIDIETAIKRQMRYGELVMDVNVVGGIMRLFGQGWRQIDRVANHTVSITMTPLGQVIAVKGLAAGDVFEAAAGLDLVSLAVGALCVGLPDKPVGVGDAWQVEHNIGGGHPIVTHTRLVRLAALPVGQTVACLETKYDLPLDWFIPIELRAMYGVRAHHKGTTLVSFNCHAGCVEEASGTIEIEVCMSVPLEELPPDLVPSVIGPDLNAPKREQLGGASERGTGGEGAKGTDEQVDEPQGVEENEGQEREEAPSEDAPPRDEEGINAPQLPRRVPMSITIRAEFQLIKLE